MNENEFEFEGIKLKAEKMPSNNMSCEKCYFHNMDCDLFHDKKLIPGCMDFERKDKREVVFVEV